MFTPNQEKAAAELTRVVGKGGRIGLAKDTPNNNCYENPGCLGLIV